jgi:hypothetical protein
VGAGGGDGVDHHLHVPAEHGGARFPAAAMRHMHDAGAAHGFEQLARPCGTGVPGPEEA